MSDASILQDAPLIVIEVDAALGVVGWNRRAELVFGTGAAAAIGRDVAEVLPLVGGSWRALADEPGPASRVMQIRQGEATLSIEVWTQSLADRSGTVVYGHDVTARVEAEAAAALEATMLTAIKDNLEISLWATDERGTFLYMDGKSMRALGMSMDQFVGKNIFEMYGSAGNNDVVASAIGGRPEFTGGVELYGEFFDTWYIPVNGAPGEVRVVGVTVNVSEAKRAELELRSKLELVERQQEVIRVLATPIIEVWDGVLTMPIVGLIDTARTAEIMDSLLQAVTQTRARFAILDLTGVEVVDTGTASHLIRMIQAIRLLGAEGILTGIHPTIAQTIVALGIDLSHVSVHARLRDALKHCIRSGAARKQATPGS
ncbi:STAS domain-containing protein [Nannocystis bainbridge]|uniref:STAS domain-containing protein n=1 Tax=Nannocystis bainbridge TaxID=2995303 RepID=A0ABT5E9R3_9BACT|nr:STAS domain-containing protein [Nannocystis bainbridge]MDC0721501.1 STAS domain-containing protein [Nannocystis bainbridge]